MFAHCLITAPLAATCTQFPIYFISSSKLPASEFSTGHFQPSSQIWCPRSVSLKSLGKFPLILIEQTVQLFFFYPLWQCNIPTTKFKIMGVRVSCFVVKLKITPDFVRFASRKHLVCFPPATHTSCVMGLSVKLLWIMHWGLLEQGLGKTKLNLHFMLNCRVFLSLSVVLFFPRKKKLS